METKLRIRERSREMNLVFGDTIYERGAKSLRAEQCFWTAVEISRLTSESHYHRTIPKQTVHTGSEAI
jgi:hypothetical protein